MKEKKSESIDTELLLHPLIEIICHRVFIFIEDFFLLYGRSDNI